MVDIKNEAEAAEQMIAQISENQAEKAAKRIENAEKVAEAEAHAQEVAAQIASGAVAPAKQSEPQTVAAEFDPATEAEAGARMIDSLLEGEEARRAKHAKEVEEIGQELLDEAGAAAKIAESVKNTARHLKEKLSR